MNDLTFQQEFDIFFFDPKISIEPPAIYGVLYLLRRDIYRCLGYNMQTWHNSGNGIFWPATMTVLAGIDLLAKFYTGDDTMGNVGNRFKRFFETYINSSNSEIIFQLRNSMLHSFGLVSKTKLKRYEFIVSSQMGELVEQFSDTIYRVDVLRLFIEFESAILKYKEDIKKNDDLIVNFQLMFVDYGKIIIG